MKQLTLILPAVQIGLLLAGLVNVVSADEPGLPVNGMSMDRVEQQFGAPVAVRGPVGDPPIVVWEYTGFKVFFEHDLVLVAGTEGVNPVAVVDQAGDDTDTGVNTETSAVTPSVAEPSDEPVPAPGKDTPVPAETLKVSYQPTDNGDTSEMPVPNLPTHGMTKAQVANLFGEPKLKAKPVGEPPIAVWTYARFKVYFEYDMVLTAAVDNAKPNTVIVGAEEDIDLPGTDPQR